MTVENQFKIDFIGIGASKSGTTWVSEVLRRHPEVYYPEKRKEIYYFNKVLPQDFKTENWEYNQPEEWYHSFFKNREPDQITGEITPCYISIENCAKDIFKYNPNVKLFAILRNPVERSYSEYSFSKQNGILGNESFKDAITKYPEKYVNTSMYYKNILPYFSLFPSENIKVFIYEEMRNDNHSFLKELYTFLKVKEYFPEIATQKINVGGRPKYEKINRLIGKTKMFIHKSGLQFILPFIKKTGILSVVKKVKSQKTISPEKKEVLSEDDRREVFENFKQDIKNLEKLLDKDLSIWKN